MPEIRCPKCDSSNINEKPYNAATGPGRGPQGNEYPPEEEHMSYECLNCGNTFYEDDVS